MKECFKCHEVLPLSEFYKHPMMADGHLGKCKECAKRDVRANRRGRREQYLAYDRERTKTPERRAALLYYGRKDPLKQKARVAVSNAVKRGKLVRQPCEVCGGSPTDAHHDDYTKPLAVRWLCRTHHVAVHFPAAA